MESSYKVKPHLGSKERLEESILLALHFHQFDSKISSKDMVSFAQTSKTHRKKLLSNQLGKKEQTQIISVEYRLERKAMLRFTSRDIYVRNRNKEGCSSRRQLSCPAITACQQHHTSTENAANPQNICCNVKSRCFLNSCEAQHRLGPQSASGADSWAAGVVSSLLSTVVLPRLEAALIGQLAPSLCCVHTVQLLTELTCRQLFW